MKIRSTHFTSLLILAIVFSHFHTMYAQNPDLYINTGFRYGFIGNFYKGITHLANQHVPGLELELQKNTKGKKEWEQEYNFPTVSYSFLAHFYDPAKPLGNSYALLVNHGKQFIRRKNWEWNYKIGLGFSYNDKLFDPQTNNKNLMVSSPINFALRASTGFHYTIAKRLLIGLGVEIFHVSNGGSKMPNMGINLPSVFIQAGYKIGGKNADSTTRSKRIKIPRSHHVHIHPSFALKEIYPWGNPKYFVGILSTYYEYRLNRKSALNLGLDFSYDFSKHASIDLLALNQPKNAGTAIQLGVVAGHELYINRFAFLAQLGIHLYDPLKIDKMVYQKAGVKYYFNEHWYMSCILKLYNGAADWVETGIAYKL